MNEAVAGTAPPSKSTTRKQAEHERLMKLRGEVTISEAMRFQQWKRYERWARNKGYMIGARKMPNHIREKAPT